MMQPLRSLHLPNEPLRFCPALHPTSLRVLPLKVRRPGMPKYPSIRYCFPGFSRARLTLHQLYTTPGLPPGSSIIGSPIASGPASGPAMCPDLRSQEDSWKKPDPDWLKLVGGLARSSGGASGPPGLHPRQALTNVLFIIFEFQGDAWAGTQLTKEENKTPSISDGNRGIMGSGDCGGE